MSTHPTAGGEGGINCKRSAQLWLDLPDDLFGNILSRIRSLRDRVRLAAICRPWRAAASRRPAPHVGPLLLLSSYDHNKKLHLCGPDDNLVFDVPGKLANRRFVGSHDGGWVAALDRDNCALRILNLFSGVEVPLSKVPSKTFPDIQRNVSKIIFSGDPTSSNGCILAAIILGRLYITSCRVGYLDGSSWTKCHWDEACFADIAFCSGDLYGLTSDSGEVQLIKFEIGMEGEGMLVVTAIQRLAIQRPTWYYDTHACYRYIFELHGKMSMAVRSKWLPNLDPFFKVFELVDVDADEAYNHKWVEMTRFGDYALFIGPRRSMAVHVTVSDEHLGLKRNHMYYTRYIYSWINKLPGDAVHSVKSDDGVQIKMYGMKDQSIEDGVERTGYYVADCNYAMWFNVPYL